MMSTSIAKLIHTSMRLTRALTVSDDLRSRLPRWWPEILADSRATFRLRPGSRLATRRRMGAGESSRTPRRAPAQGAAGEIVRVGGKRTAPAGAQELST